MKMEGLSLTQFQGFKTLEEAKKFKRKKGYGVVCWDERTPKWNKLTSRGWEYKYCVDAGGLNQNEYPYAVTWNI